MNICPQISRSLRIPMLNTTRKVLSLLALSFAFTAFAAAQAPPATGAGAGGTKIGVIDIQRAILATNEGRRDFEALTNKFAPKQAATAPVKKPATAPATPPKQ